MKQIGKFSVYNNNDLVDFSDHVFRVWKNKIDNLYISELDFKITCFRDVITLESGEKGHFLCKVQ